jgi:hypothetical protein
MDCHKGILSFFAFNRDNSRWNIHRHFHTHRGCGNRLSLCPLPWLSLQGTKIKRSAEMFWVSIKQSVALLFIMAAANFFGWFIIYQKIPDNIIATLSGYERFRPRVMAMFIVIIIILGLFLEGNAIFSSPYRYSFPSPSSMVSTLSTSVS